MNPAFFTTVFQAPAPTGGWPGQFGVITAANPGGRGAARYHADANSVLADQLQRAGYAVWPVLARSPDGRHREPSLATTAPRAILLHLARAHHQAAIFSVRQGQVYVDSAGGRARRYMAPWGRRWQGQGAGRRPRQ